MKRIIVVCVVVVILFLGVGFFFFPPKKGGDSGQTPLITANFVDPKMIQAITKFRSCQGHLVVPQNSDETKRNMKHYFYLKKKYTAEPGMVAFYAPFDGYVQDIMGFKGEEGRSADSKDLTISAQKGFIARHNSWSFIFLHIVPKDGLKKGDAVKAGESVGHAALDIPPFYSFDVIYGQMASFPKRIDNWMDPYAELDSVFNHMSDRVLAEYKVLGADSKDDFINSKEYRDANPCQYEGSGPRFNPSANRGQMQDDFVGTL